MLSACCWAVAAILFRRVGERITAMGINLAKGLVSMLFMAVLLLPGFYSGLATLDTNSLAALALSGIIGICFGDTLYFLALMRLGARRTLLLGSEISFPTVEIEQGIYKSDSDSLIDHYSKKNGIINEKLVTLEYYKNGIFGEIIRLFKENRELKSKMSDP